MSQSNKKFGALAPSCFVYKHVNSNLIKTTLLGLKVMKLFSLSLMPKLDLLKIFLPGPNTIFTKASLAKVKSFITLPTDAIVIKLFVFETLAHDKQAICLHGQSPTFPLFTYR
jgi:hypothetical protein